MQMAHTKDQRFLSLAAPCSKVLRAFVALILCIAIALPIGSAVGSMGVDAPQDISIFLSQFDDHDDHDTANITMAHCGQPSSCSSATLFVHPLSEHAKRSMAILPTPDSLALSWNSTPPGPPPKALVAI